MGITHAKVSPKADGTDTTLVRPSDWNADHVITRLEINSVGLNNNAATGAVDSLIIDTKNLVPNTGAATFLNAFYVEHNVGGSASKGGRQGIYSLLQFEAPSSAANTNRFYVSMVAQADIQSGDGGGIGSESGAFLALNPYIIARPAATHMLELNGAEWDITAEAGSSMLYKFGQSIGALATDAVQGSVADAMLYFGGQPGSVGWKDIILIGSKDGNGFFPSDVTNGTIIRATSGAARNGIDLANVVFSNKSLLLPMM